MNLYDIPNASLRGKGTLVGNEGYLDMSGEIEGRDVASSHKEWIFSRLSRGRQEVIFSVT
jgi:hypothetical protein